MPRAKRNTPFQPGHGLFYGLRPVSRDPETNTVTSVACRFCEKFGREEKVGAKRRATQHVKHFKQPFRTENYHQHHLGQHPTRWTEYQVLPADRKASYLALDTSMPPGHEPHDPYTHIDNVVNAAVSESQSLPSRTRLHPPQRSLPPSHMSSLSAPLKFVIQRPIIDKIVADILFDQSVSPISKEQAVAAFSTIHESMADYIVTIHNPYIFNLVVNQVATGATPEIASKVIAETIPIDGTSSPSQTTSTFGDCSLASVFAYLRSVCAFNLHALADLAKASWGFTVSFRRIFHKDSYFVDVLFRFSISDSLKSFHLLALPPQDRFNWETSYANLTRVLDVVHDRWREKMIGIATDGFELAEGGTHIIVDRLAQEASRSIIRTWSAANRISAVVKTVHSAALDPAFFDTLTQLTAYFRRQDGFRTEKDHTCPTFTLTNWQTLETTLKWIKSHRMTMLRLIQEKKPACSPSMSWWILAMAVLEFTQAVSKTYRRVCGFIAGVFNPLPELTELVKTLNRLSGCKGPVTDNELSMLRDWDLIVDNKFVVQKSAVRMFLSGLGTFVHMAMDGLSPTALDEVVKRVGAMFLAGIVQLTDVISERESGYQGPSYLPAVLPHELVRLSRASFNECVRSQAGRLAITTEPAEIEAIEDEFGELVEAYHREDTFQDLLNLTSKSRSFHDAWGNIKYKFRRLHRFCGVIATVFPEVSADEGSASLLPLDCEVFRESPKDFVVEASLHCPQYKSLESLSKELQTITP